jgi:hypothetical protein
MLDFSLSITVACRLLRASAVFALICLLAGEYDLWAQENADATTLRRKILCGYQGWFRCPGDGSGEGWLHWSRDSRRLTPRTLTVKMWPDMSEYGEEERYAAPGFTHADGAPAYLFSSHNGRTVERHFQWMEQYGIDGAFLQRFLVNLGRPSFDRVLAHVRNSAAETGRVWAVCYDLTGAPADRLVDLPHRVRGSSHPPSRRNADPRQGGIPARRHSAPPDRRLQL